MLRFLLKYVLIVSIRRDEPVTTELYDLVSLV